VLLLFHTDRCFTTWMLEHYSRYEPHGNVAVKVCEENDINLKTLDFRTFQVIDIFQEAATFPIDTQSAVSSRSNEHLSLNFYGKVP
jgi:hypothetical protein